MGMPAIGGKQYQGSGPAMAAAYQGAQDDAAAQDPSAGGDPSQGPAEGGEQGALTEIEARIMRLEEALVSRGVLHDTDLQGGPGPSPDPAGAPPGAPPDQGAPAGAPPAPPQGPPA